MHTPPSGEEPPIESSYFVLWCADKHFIIIMYKFKIKSHRGNNTQKWRAAVIRIRSSYPLNNCHIGLSFVINIHIRLSKKINTPILLDLVRIRIFVVLCGLAGGNLHVGLGMFIISIILVVVNFL